ncbi:hypothetical protein [Nocardia aurantiaca]|uniref:Uncharacterized protein n=1 Tax=Nocardia aurantiaca TaxID=2675850 RepID=A0A6I3L7D3_9NOCA|nr:hypothetical protein [Nocardia aurantiaca]MTE16296.1 hypothetical protein [Nocardia aurantiaca]
MEKPRPVELSRPDGLRAERMAMPSAMPVGRTPSAWFTRARWFSQAMAIASSVSSFRCGSSRFENSSMVSQNMVLTSSCGRL